MVQIAAKSVVRRAGRRGKAAGPQAARRGERREAIVAAALEEFSARGFAATRLDADVARRAGVAKGTIYLYFRDKESLFQELVRAMVSPLVGAITTAPLQDVPIRVVIEMIVDVFVNEIRRYAPQGRAPTDHRRGAALPQACRILLSRGHCARAAGPAGAAHARSRARRAPHDALARFPQLLVAPGLMAIIWSSLFERFERLDVRALMHAHLDLLFGERRAPERNAT